MVDAERHDGHRQVGRQHRRAVEHLLLEALLVAARTARDEHRADGEHGKRVHHIQHGGIEHRLVAEDRRHHGIAHKAHIAENQCEADGALMVGIAREIARQQETRTCQQQIGEDADEQQRKDVLAVGQLARHRRRQDERRTGDVDDQPRQLAVEVASQITQFARHIAYHHEGKQCQHHNDHSDIFLI